MRYTTLGIYLVAFCACVGSAIAAPKQLNPIQLGQVRQIAESSTTSIQVLSDRVDVLDVSQSSQSASIYAIRAVDASQSGSITTLQSAISFTSYRWFQNASALLQSSTEPDYEMRQPFDSSLADTTGNRTMTVSFGSPSYTAGIVGRALNGSGILQTTGGVGSGLGITNTDWYVSMWVRYNSGATQWRMQEVSGTEGYDLTISGAGQFAFKSPLDGAYGLVNFSPTNQVPTDSSWHYIELTHVGTTMYFWVDGSTVDTTNVIDVSSDASFTLNQSLGSWDIDELVVELTGGNTTAYTPTTTADAYTTILSAGDGQVTVSGDLIVEGALSVSGDAPYQPKQVSFAPQYELTSSSGPSSDGVVYAEELVSDTTFSEMTYFMDFAPTTRTVMVVSGPSDTATVAIPAGSVYGKSELSASVGTDSGQTVSVRVQSGAGGYPQILKIRE